MKKVKSIGKKVMSGGLAASLLLAPVSANKCFAAPKDAQQIMEEQKKANKVYRDSKESNLILIALILIFAAYCGYNNPETVKKAAEVISGSVKGTCNFIGDKKEEITNFWTIYGDEITLEGKWIVENIKNISYDIYFFIKLLCESAYNIGESVYNILNTIGFKNTSAIAVTGYLGKKVYDLGKGAYNKVSGLFKSKKNEQENKDNKGKLKQTENINVNNVNVNNLNVNNLDEDWFNNHRDELKRALGL